MKRLRRFGAKENPVYEARTRDIVVRVSPSYQTEQSAPEEGRWFWTYTVEIENHGAETVQLVSRHWVITDGLNRREDVRGPGVVGEQPLIAPGRSHDYVSGCPLATPHGSMEGHYTFVHGDGTRFDAAIPFFPLAAPATAG